MDNFARVRRRGLLWEGAGEDGEAESPEGVSIRVRVRNPAREDPNQIADLGRWPCPSADPPANKRSPQINDRDCAPSTVTLAPLIQLARGDARNATTAPTSSG